MRKDAENPKPYRTGEMPMLGDLVKIPDEEVDSYKSNIKPKIKDRVGYVSGFTCPSSQPIVKFSAIGRKKEFTLGQVPSRWLQFISRAQGN